MAETGGQLPSAQSSRDRWLYIILLFAFVLRTYHLNYPPWDYHNWRQTHTLMVARDFARRGFHPLTPQVQWVSLDQPSQPTYHSGEFSIEGLLAAVLYRILGESDAAARLVVIAFSLLGLYFLYSLLNRNAGREAARLGAFVLALFPYSLFFGRVFMPDVPAMALALGGLDMLDRWRNDHRMSILIVAAALTALALLQKLTLVIVGLPAVYLFWSSFRHRLLTRPEPYVFAGVAGLPPLAWYQHALTLGKLGGGTIMPVSSFGTNLARWADPKFLGETFLHVGGEAFAFSGFALAVAGFFWLEQTRATWIFRLWVVAAGLFLFLIPNTLADNYYYLLLLAPGAAALAGMALVSLASRPRLRPVVVLLLGLFAADSIRTALPLYQADRAPHDLGALLSRLTSPQDLILAASGGSPNVLYAADRRGWIDARYDSARLERLRRVGARYYASVFAPSTPDDRQLLNALDAQFHRLTPADAPWPIYELIAPPGLTREMPKEKIQNPYPVNFGDRIEMLGISVRELLAWPSSFEVTYYWQCLKKVDLDLMVFVHVTNAEGKTVFQQDHWPANGRWRTLGWGVGDVIRERYVMVAPNYLPGGRYQVRLGWYDPVTGKRLPILSPGSSDGEDRAVVADVEVRRPPRYRWLSVDD